jgi:hypothetical protein
VIIGTQPYQATVININSSCDLALLQINVSGLTPIKIAKTTPSVSVVVNGYGYRQGRGLLRRIFGGIKRVFRNGNCHTICIAAGSPMGYSGGPFINNETGEVVGIIATTNGFEAYGPSCVMIWELYGQYIIFETNPNPIPVPTPTPDPEDPCKELREQIEILAGKVDQLATKIDETHNQVVDINGWRQSVDDQLQEVPNIILKQDEIDVKLTNIETRIEELSGSTGSPINKDEIVEEVYLQIQADVVKLRQDLNERLDQIEEKIPDCDIDYDHIINEVVSRLSDDVDDDRERLLYFTSEGCSHCERTDEMAQALLDSGYPINIITLEPTDTVVKEVPKVYNTESKEEIRGTSNVITYFSVLTQ